MAANQDFNFQTYYTEKKEELDDNLEYFTTLDGTINEYKNPEIFKQLYQLAWDYFALGQDTAHNFAVYNAYIALAANAPNIAAGAFLNPAMIGDDRMPAAIDTTAEFEGAMNLYCKNMGKVIGAKIMSSNNLDEVIEWVKDNGVYQATLPVNRVAFAVQDVPGAPGAAAAAAAHAALQSGAEAINNYAAYYCIVAEELRPGSLTSLRERVMELLQEYSDTFHTSTGVVVATDECDFFRTQMARFTAGLNNAQTITAYDNAGAAYVGNVPRGTRFNGSIFLTNSLLTMTRNSVATRQTYNNVKKLLNSTPTSFSLVKEIESSVVTLNNQVAVVPNAVPVQATAKTMDIFTGVGYNNVIDRLKTAMPRRLTHTCKPNCNTIYAGAAPIVRIMVYRRPGGSGPVVYVAPIQTRGATVNEIISKSVGGQINTFQATAVEGPQGLPPPLPLQAVYNGGARSIDVLNRLNAMPGPNPQPLKKNWFKIIKTENPSPCTTDAWDLENMQMLPSSKVSNSHDGHGHWQSIPNYATCWLIKHSDRTVTPKSDGYNLFTQTVSTIKVFQFNGKNTIPYDDNNCELPEGYEMLAMWPSGKLIYKHGSDFTVEPPKGSYWKEWSGAEYDVSYMAEIGYQEAKARYDAGRLARTQQELSVNDQIELFQMAAHKKMEEYGGTKNDIRLAGIAGVGGSGNNKNKRYNKKTVMSMLKTAKRKYFTRRNKRKQ
jgi:hypothetical protein